MSKSHEQIMKAAGGISHMGNVFESMGVSLEEATKKLRRFGKVISVPKTRPVPKIATAFNNESLYEKRRRERKERE